ncbi:hypothetical protein B0T17DRAFT_508753 [Bombardia bombarda]|uniref:Uncharacterized protein n=1 Tax=Bombardia bombarda TaxID=252184 RepID=A0AA39WTM8_9PEZI|nr:hypothetical protein B0T17DRAFT_508753 [Bombardia bombarda]
MYLHALAPELLSLILKALDRPRDLHSLIRASAPCFRVYALSPVLILSSILRNAILPDALHHALAHGHIPATPSNESLEAFLDEYFQADSFGFPTDKATLVTLCRLFSQTCYFIDDYSARAMHTLDPEPNPGQATALSLSRTERARLQRAFYRYELYSRVFPVDSNARCHSLVPADVQFSRFLARIEPWEAEEMSCAYHYFTSLMGRFIYDLEEQVVETVLASPDVRRPPSLACPFPNGQGRADDSDMVLFNCLDLRDLDLFSNDGRFRSPGIVSYLASLGSAFIYQLVLADKGRRKDMIREKTPVWRDFLPEALDHAPDTGPKTIVPDGIDDNQPSHPNLGYYLFKRSEQDVYFHIRHDGILNCPLRETAFVFWDAEKIFRPPVGDNLRETRRMDPKRVNQLYNRYRGKSAEEWLEGVKIPRAQMERIIEEFGSVFDSW